MICAILNRRGLVVEVGKTAKDALHRWSEYFYAGHHYHSLVSYSQRKRYMSTLGYRIAKGTFVERSDAASSEAKEGK